MTTIKTALNRQVTEEEVIAASAAGKFASLYIADRIATKEEAEAIAAKFPKVARVYANEVHHGGGLVTFSVEAFIRPGKTATTGEVNEAGIRQVRKIFQVVASL